MTIQYIGKIFYNEKEGYRVFYLIPCEYINLSGGINNFLPVYISSGVSSGKECSEKICIIPYLGSYIRYWKHKNESHLSPTIVKVDYYQIFKGIIDEEISDFYKNDIEEKDIENYINSLSYKNKTKINKNETKINHDTIKQLKSKIGKKHFLACINKYKNSISNHFKVINNTDDKFDIINTDKLNKMIGSNNLVGISYDDQKSLYFNKSQQYNLKLLVDPYELDHVNYKDVSYKYNNLDKNKYMYNNIIKYSTPIGSIYLWLKNKNKNIKISRSKSPERKIYKNKSSKLTRSQKI